MGSLFDTYMAQGYEQLRTAHGETATYQSVAGGNPSTITVYVVSPNMVVTASDGEYQDRTISLSVRVLDVATPRRGDTYTLTSAGNAGTWIASEVTHQDDISCEIRCRNSQYNIVGSDGVREVEG